MANVNSFARIATFNKESALSLSSFLDRLLVLSINNFASLLNISSVSDVSQTCNPLSNSLDMINCVGNNTYLPLT